MSITNITTGATYATVSAAITASSAKDVIQLSAGSYVEDFPDITHTLTIRSTGGLASLSRATPLTSTGRAVINVPGELGIDLTLSGLEISGAARPGANPNGAGILFEQGNGALTVTYSWIHGNEDGILAGGTTANSPSGGATVLIDHSEISNDGAPAGSAYAANGLDHNLYIGSVTSFTLTNSYVHGVFSQGNEIKSRALSTTITDNRIFDLRVPAGLLGSSYDIDVPNGGIAVISGNVIEKGADAVNRYVIHFAGEGTYANSSLLVSGNTIINDRGAGATAVLNQSRGANNANIPATINGNTLYFIAPSELFQDSFGPPSDTASGNVFSSGPAPTLDTTSPVACFAAGTRIATRRGPVAVEDLRPGDLVRTPLDEGWAPVVWTGHRRVDCARHPDPETLWPIRILPHAFGPGMPERVLYLSPDHAIQAGGGLIPARLLVNGASIAVARECRSVTYYHVELPRHDILLAEGLPAESYLDTGNRHAFENAGPTLLLHPRFEGGQARRLAGSRLPLLCEPAAVEPVWRALAQRAVEQGRTLPAPPVLTDDADPHLRAGTMRIRASRVDGGRHLFALPAHSGPIWLMSRAARPSLERPWVEDRRMLGVRVGLLRLRRGQEDRAIPLDLPLYGPGWWATEPDTGGPRRWTDGAALIPLLEQDSETPAVLEVFVTESLSYPVADDTVRETYGVPCPRARQG